ncbi:DUF2971 domain-containing protein [Lutimaribacter saemankumensis]|uniref:DUF2971 domain-containing protein n=1 Tax=Lutimaribacter saemankumensis TaxID=490829 RepID=A0A1G8TCD7_9RHOB|nr:DUF2971 domain-containing protein [Lutimaribacter saemankumensis]SDJ39037.1 Protein of unknown function [Lutimaribacter saemankumensis]
MSDFVPSLGNPEEHRPKLLFHYCSLAGLLGILESQSFWISDASTMNDAKEIVHVRDILEQAVEQGFRDIGVSDNVWFTKIRSQIRGLGLQQGRCVFSLCAEADQLSLWRSYGADGQGASIGFDSSLLLETMARKNIHLHKVIYVRSEQLRICRDFVRFLFGKHSITGKVDELSEAVVKEMQDFVTTYGILMKHPSFADEREWRLVCPMENIYSGDWRYRPRGNMIVPYLQVAAPELFQSTHSGQPPYRITLGPRCERTPTSTALQAITRKLLGTSFGVSLSAVPYRG